MGDNDVVGLDITVEDAAGVCVLEYHTKSAAGQGNASFPA